MSPLTLYITRILLISIRKKKLFLISEIRSFLRALFTAIDVFLQQFYERNGIVKLYS
jgi:hypothetical protein